MHYVIRETAHPPNLEDVFDGSPWAVADIVTIADFHPRSSDHRPITRARVLRHQRTIHFRFGVEDRFVRCTRTGFQQAVCNDSCVEMFIQPRPDRGYFNFEFNCGGAMLLYYIEDASRASRRRSSGTMWFRMINAGS